MGGTRLAKGDAAAAAADEADEDARLASQFAHRVDLFAGRIGARFGLGASAADDLVSAGYWGLLQALRNRRPEAHPRELSAYVSRRIEGAVFDEARRILGRAQRVAFVDPLDLDRGAGWGDGPCFDAGEARGSVDSDPEHALERETRWRQVDESLAALEEEGRAFLMAYAGGESLAELARHDGSSPGRVQARMTRWARTVRARSPELRRILRQEL